jgi:hypothetical protein
MRHLLVIILSSVISPVCGQNTIDWSENYQIQLSDFKSPTTQIGNTNIYSLYPACSFDFSFSMTKAEFMFTKNFNSKVNCYFNRNAASILAPDSVTADALVRFSRYDFDLTELYARKFRKKLFEEKGAFSNVSFFRPIYDSIQNELSNRHTIAGSSTDVGKNKGKLEELHKEVLKEISELSDFCKTCKPQKKKG